MVHMHERFGAINPEIGAMIHLDHVNFETPDHDMATVFYVNGLGLTRDPYRRADETNMGINVGLQQFHLPRRGETTPPFPGIVGLVVPDLESIKERCELLAGLGKFDGTPYRWEGQNETVLLTSPFGIRLRLHPAGSIPFLRPLGIAYVEIAIPPGTAGGIGRFYEKVVRAPIEIGRVRGETAALVRAGPHQQVRFIEQALDDYETHSMHISYHVAHYNELREVLAEHGSLTSSGRGEVFFFDKIYDPDDDGVIFVMNNEVRSIYHRDFMRPLVNRWPIIEEPFTDPLRQ